MSVDFSNLTSVNFDDVKRPAVKPPGTYHAVISDYKFDVSSQKKTPYVRFSFTGLSAGEDVDQDLLKEEDGTPIDLTKWKPTTRGLSDFYLTPESTFRLKEFLEELGVSTAGRSIGECLPETKGMPVLLTVSMKSNQDGTGFFNQIDKVDAAK